MSKGTGLQGVLHYFQTVAAPQASGATDGHLLERFILCQEEEAFAELVRRHGPMVLGACRRILRNAHDAEDAFQATFLVLLRRAGSVHPRDQVGHFLYGVACRTALEARRAAARRRAREACALPRLPAADDLAELTAVLDVEVNRLPAKYRSVVVLCDLGGKTRKEAAAALGWAEGTVSSRLSRGRSLLAARLRRRGVTTCGALLAGGMATAAVPGALADATVTAVLLSMSAGSGALAINVAFLVRKMVQPMWKSKLYLALVLMAALPAAAALGLRHASGAPEGAAPAPAAAAPPVAAADKPADGDDGDKPSVKSMPPVVVRTVPEAGDTHVDATKVTEVRVTFSKKMTDKNWSWSQISDESFPKTIGDPFYDKDQRTCVLPVKLEPGKTYVFWLNSAKFGNFKDADGRSAVPYLLVFETKR
jgi:RNA polymerase sigma-70 factor (ECF subfamily)